MDNTVIETYRIDTTDSDDVAGLDREALEERERLRAIRNKLRDKDITVERYVRVPRAGQATRT